MPSYWMGEAQCGALAGWQGRVHRSSFQLQGIEEIHLCYLGYWHDVIKSGYKRSDDGCDGGWYWWCWSESFFLLLQCCSRGVDALDWRWTAISHGSSTRQRRGPHVSDDLNLGWLIHYVSGHRMPKPCKAMGNLKSDTLSLIHHMILWIAIWICLISITAAPPKYYHVLLLSSKYSKRSHKVLQRITSSHYQELQRMDLLQPATCFSQIRCPSER